MSVGRMIKLMVGWAAEKPYRTFTLNSYTTGGGIKLEMMLEERTDNPVGFKTLRRTLTTTEVNHTGHGLATSFYNMLRDFEKVQPGPP